MTFGEGENKTCMVMEEKLETLREMKFEGRCGGWGREASRMTPQALTLVAGE